MHLFAAKGLFWLQDHFSPSRECSRCLTIRQRRPAPYTLDKHRYWASRQLSSRSLRDSEDSHTCFASLFSPRNKEIRCPNRDSRVGLQPSLLTIFPSSHIVVIVEDVEDQDCQLRLLPTCHEAALVIGVVERLACFGNDFPKIAHFLEIFEMVRGLCF